MIDNEYRGTDKDRKSSAAYFTREPAASLLAALALEGDRPRYAQYPTAPINIYDFACGAGILLVEAAQRLDGYGVKNPVHLYGVDINPTSLETCRRNMVELVAECSIDIHPHIYRAPFGLQNDGTCKVGSLEAIRPDWTWADFELIHGEPAPTDMVQYHHDRNNQGQHTLEAF